LILAINQIDFVLKSSLSLAYIWDIYCSIQNTTAAYLNHLPGGIINSFHQTLLMDVPNLFLFSLPILVDFIYNHCNFLCLFVITE